MGYIRKSFYAPFKAFLDSVLPRRGEKLLIENTTDCTGVDTGALQVKGGGYIAKNLLVDGTITGNLTGNVTGNASTATALQTARTIFGTNFDCTANITSVTGKIETTSTASDSIKTAGGGQFAGNVGIGTSSPSGRLTVRTVSTSRTLGTTGSLNIESNDTSSFGGLSELNFSFGGNFITSSIAAVYTNFAAYGQLGSALTFNTTTDSSSGLTERMRITSAGNVGIGTTSPTVRLHVVGGKLQVDDTSADSIKTSGGADIAGQVDWAGGNVIYVPIGASIADAITGATAGDTIVLGAGTYAITAEININKALNIVGQGEEKTKVNNTDNTTSKGVFKIGADNIRIADMSLNKTVASQDSFGINGAGNSYSGIVLENLTIGIAETQNAYGILLYNISCIIKNVKTVANSTTSTSNGLYIRADSNSSSNAVVQIFNCNLTGTCTTGSGRGLRVQEQSSSHTITAYVYDTIATGTGSGATGAGIYTDSGADAYVYAYNSIISGQSADVRQTDSSTLQLSNCTLVNNTTSGTITYAGTQRVNALQSSGTITVGAYTLPATDGTDGQVLVTNGEGVLTWTTL